MTLVGAVGKIETRHVHSGIDHFVYGFFVPAGGTESAYYFCPSHNLSSNFCCILNVIR